MEISNLTEDELRLFFEYFFTKEMLSRIFKANKKLSKTIKGFRVEKMNKGNLAKNIANFMIKTNDFDLYKLAESMYSDSKNIFRDKKNKYINEGLKEEYANAYALVKTYKNEVLPLVFKLKNIDKEEQERISEIIKLIDLIESVYKLNLKNELDTLEMKNEKSSCEKEKAFNDKIVDIHKRFNLADENYNKQQVELNNVTKRMNSVEQSFISENDIKNIIVNELKKVKTDIYLKLEGLKTGRTSDTKINQDLKAIKNVLGEINKTRVNDTIDVISFTNDEFDSCDDYLEENIGDIIEQLTPANHFEILKEYLIEIIYSNKPIICSENNASFLAKVLSSIISGGNYYVLTQSRESKDSELIEKLESLSSIKGNKVVVIKNKIGVSDVAYLVNYIKKRPFNEKYIFEIMFDKEAYFFPIEYLDYFNFYFADYKIKELEYNYYYDFSNSNRKPLENNNYKNILDTLEVNLSNTSLMNINFYGLLIYSIIPFIAINKNLEVGDLINLLVDTEIRKKCEVVYND